jgi:acyl-coenzyme A synthetase/AMP-(fatty) acid ligase
LNRAAAARSRLRRQWYEEGWYSHRTVSLSLAEGASLFGDRTFTVISRAETHTSTLRSLHARGLSVAGGLANLGLRAGDVLVMQLPTSMEAAIAYQAASALGLVVVPVLHTHGPADLSFIVRESQARALVIPQRWHSIEYASHVEQVSGAPTLTHVVMVGGATSGDVVPWYRLEQAAKLEENQPAITADDVHMLVYTSGTTSAPKGVQHTHNSILHEARAWDRIVGSAYAASGFLQPSPLGHMTGVLGTLLRPYLLGQTTVAFDTWDASAATKRVQLDGIVVASGVPYFLDTFLAATSGTKTPLSVWVTGGSSVPPALITRADSMGITALRSYGSTEHPTVTASRVIDSLDHRSGTDGRLLPGCRIRIVDDAGRELTSGHVGEITTIGPDQFLGYRDDTLDAESFNDDGWFLTGDLGFIDDNGLLTVTDRKKDIIIRGGENISARQVEEVLRRHPLVTDVAVIGVPDNRYGERVAAFIVARDGTAVTLDAVRSLFHEAGLDAHKVPEYVRVVDGLPRTESGKIKKYELRRQWDGSAEGEAR